jgi:hypothetical protein
LLERELEGLELEPEVVDGVVLLDGSLDGGFHLRHPPFVVLLVLFVSPTRIS